jgi:hypothetical protein
VHLEIASFAIISAVTTMVAGSIGFALVSVIGIELFGVVGFVTGRIRRHVGVVDDGGGAILLHDQKQRSSDFAWQVQLNSSNSTHTRTPVHVHVHQHNT